MSVQWTDEEKANVYFQIMEKLGGNIPWNDLELPEGRTVKAVQVMIGKEKTKYKKSKAVGNSGGEAAMGAEVEGGKKKAAAGVKRGASEAVDDKAIQAKKSRVPRAKAKAAVEAEEAVEESVKKEEGDGPGD